MSFALVVLAGLLLSGPCMCGSDGHPDKFHVPPLPEHFTSVVEVVDPEANMTLSVFNYYYNSHHHFERKDFDYDGVKIVIVYDEKTKSVCLLFPFPTRSASNSVIQEYTFSPQLEFCYVPRPSNFLSIELFERFLKPCLREQPFCRLAEYQSEEFDFFYSTAAAGSIVYVTRADTGYPVLLGFSFRYVQPLITLYFK